MKIEQAGEQGRGVVGEQKESGQSQWSVQNCWQFVVEQIASWSLCWRLICKWPRVCCWPLPEWLGIKLVTLFILPAHPVAPTAHNPYFPASQARAKLFELIQRKKINESASDPLLSSKHLPLPLPFPFADCLDFRRLWLSSNKMKLNKFLSQILFAYCRLCHRPESCLLFDTLFMWPAPPADRKVTFIYGNCWPTFSEPFTLGLYVRLVSRIIEWIIKFIPFLLNI